MTSKHYYPAIARNLKPGDVIASIHDGDDNGTNRPLDAGDLRVIFVKQHAGTQRIECHVNDDATGSPAAMLDLYPLQMVCLRD